MQSGQTLGLVFCGDRQIKKPFDEIRQRAFSFESERQDSNLRPLRPKRSALAKLSYAPRWRYDVSPLNKPSHEQIAVFIQV